LDKFKREELNARFTCPECHEDMSVLTDPYEERDQRDFLLVFQLNEAGDEELERVFADEVTAAKDKWTEAADRADAPAENLEFMLSLNLHVLQKQRVQVKFRTHPCPCPLCGFVDVLGYRGVCGKCLLPVYARLHGYWTLGDDDYRHDPGCFDTATPQDKFQTKTEFHPAESSDPSLVARAERALKGIEETAARKAAEERRQELARLARNLEQQQSNLKRDLEGAAKIHNDAEGALATLESQQGSLLTRAAVVGGLIGLPAGCVPACVVGFAAGDVAALLVWALVIGLVVLVNVNRTKNRGRAAEALSAARKAVHDAEARVRETTDRLETLQRELESARNKASTPQANG
jgi:hypothetical protein